MATRILSDGTIQTYGKILSSDLTDIANFYRQHFGVNFTGPSGKILLSDWNNLRQAILNGAGTTWGVDAPVFAAGIIRSSTWPVPKMLIQNFDITITTTTTDWNLIAAIQSLGWNSINAVNLHVTVNSGVVVGSTSSDSHAMTFGALPENSTVTLINNGYIVGKGGDGAGVRASIPTNTYYGEDGHPGGPALLAQTTLYIQNNGIIGGGGGGGFADYANNSDFHDIYGGGGGAGYTPGKGGYSEGDANPSPATDGTLTSGGVAANTAGGPFAGNGGALGTKGQGSQDLGPRHSLYNSIGGAPGNAVDGIRYITWISQGDVRGQIT